MGHKCLISLQTEFTLSLHLASWIQTWVFALSQNWMDRIWILVPVCIYLHCESGPCFYICKLRVSHLSSNVNNPCPECISEKAFLATPNNSLSLPFSSFMFFITFASISVLHIYLFTYILSVSPARAETPWRQRVLSACSLLNPWHQNSAWYMEGAKFVFMNKWMNRWMNGWIIVEA